MTELPDLVVAGYSNLWVLHTNAVEKHITGIWQEREARYHKFKSKGYYLAADESPAVTEQLQRMVTEVEQALPNVLTLTNNLTLVLSNSATLTSNLNAVALSAQPTFSNLAKATAHLDQPGSLGEWLIPTNVNWQLEGTLSNANLAVLTESTNLANVMVNSNRSLDNVANITSNLDLQVAA